MADILTLTEYKAATGVIGTEHDGQYNFAIPAANQAIKNFTDRDFGADLVNEARDFAIPDSQSSDTMTIDIDDCDEVFSVYTLSANQWVAGSEGPAAAAGVFTYLDVASFRAVSPLMGFTRNEDIFLNRVGLSRSVTVTANWGWPVVPADVKQAAVWAVDALLGDLSNPGGTLAAKSVAEVAENYMQQQAQMNSSPDDEEPLPARARSLLLPYRRVSM